MKRKWLNFFLCALSGILSGLCLMLPLLGPAIFLTAVPAFALLRRKVKFSYCIAFAVALCMVGYFPAFSVKPDMDLAAIFWIDFCVYTVICLVHGLVLSAALLLGFRLPCPKFARWLYVSLFWTVAELILGSGPLAWPTLRLSLAVWKYPIFFQSARFGGQLLVSAVIISVNMLFAKAFVCTKKKQSLICAALAIAVLLSDMAFALFSPPLPDSDTQVALIQPGLTAVDGYSQIDTSLKARDLAEEAAKTSPDLIVLSEGSMPTVFADEPRSLYSWGYIPKDADADMIACGNMNNRSTAYHFTPDGTLLNIRKKVLEVPFFENGVDGNFQWIPDEPEPVIATRSGKIGILICYESMFSSHTHKHIRNGAELLAVVTNDSWFDTPLAQNLHLANGVYRAVETGRYLVQAAMNGATAAIDMQGNIIAELKSPDPGILYADISMKPQATPYLLWGDCWIAFWLFTSIIGSAITIIHTKKKCSSH